ncbi:hypothetical protein TEA_016438 [Camellia sinensis var. sinensis]|uniref:Protein kinase domain-containing protein n=1 Tax=Camellia sinensis var. sinensis TaxID=542762 RepID=A0A4S4DCN1_CAMSN|nr:hypothetical protein TEA_016438 [Camellia sinensis var. sinensis]
MAFPSVFAFFIVSHLVILYSNGHPLNSPESFDCGNLGQIKFPFSNDTYPRCGLCMANFSETVPKILLGKGKSYEVDKFLKDEALKVSENLLGDLISSESCKNFSNLTVPNRPPIFFKILTDNLALFKCNISSHELHQRTIHCFRGNYCYGGWPGYTVYCKNPNPHVQIPSNKPCNCEVIQLPIIQPIVNPNARARFSLLAAEFSILFHVLIECPEFHLKGVQCLDLPEFQCKTSEGHQKPGTSHLKLILETGFNPPTSVDQNLFLLPQFLVTFTEHFTSPDPSSKPDLEGGSVYFGVPVFSYTELEEATNNFDPSKELGDGGFGTVYHVLMPIAQYLIFSQPGNLQDGRDVAVKRLYEHNYRRIAQFMNEIKILTHLRHRNLVSLYGCTSRLSRELLLIYEYIPNGTVADHIHGDRAKDRPLLWPIRMSIAIETASALVYLHASDIIHRDVKTNNILLDNDFCVKVADFGLSRLFPIGVTHVSTAPQGTPGYLYLSTLLSFSIYRDYKCKRVFEMSWLSAHASPLLCFRWLASHGLMANSHGLMASWLPHHGQNL